MTQIYLPKKLIGTNGETDMANCIAEYDCLWHKHRCERGHTNHWIDADQRHCPR